MTHPIGFIGSPLDRLEPAHKDPHMLARLAADPTALLIDMTDYVPSVADGRIMWRAFAPLPPEETLLLGLIDGTPRFAHIDPSAAAARRSSELMALLDSLEPGEAATYATARSLLDWHARHRFCANCGVRSLPHHAGWARQCPACGTEHFPRTDPVVIMLVTSGEKCLLGRQKQFMPGMWSCLAGFVEAAETIEDAVRREIFEESGIRCTDVSYYMTQPWPYPSSLMIGCAARALNEDIVVDRTELEDARWFDRAEVALMHRREHPDGLFAAHPFAIAHHLIGRWVHGGNETSA